MTTIPQYASDLFERIRFTGAPVANPDSVVISGQARFTILTPRLIRLEWSAAGQFEDRATYAFPTRYGPTPDFTVQVEAGVLTIDTGALRLRYVEDSGRFSAGNLSIAFDFNDEPHTWKPGSADPMNLRGTRRTLDVCEGDAALEEGLLSRAGWALCGPPGASPVPGRRPVPAAVPGRRRRRARSGSGRCAG